MRPRQHTLSSRFAAKIEEYIQLMHRLGKVFRVEEGHLYNFDAYCLQQRHDGPLTQQVALNFSYSVPDLGSCQYAKRYQIIRGFANFLSTFEPKTESLDPHAISVTPHRTPAYIYTDEEIVLLLQTVSQLRFRDSFRIVTYQTLLGLIASTGLRIREALRLNIEDVNLSTGVLHIRQSKFRKSRLVPIHPTTRQRLERYSQRRATRGAPANEPAFFVSHHLKRLSYSTINNVFQTLRRKANLRSATNRPPRIHDLRHTFAVRRVLEWYEAGVDVQAKLPLLATYLGHAHFEDTAYYLNVGGELLAKAAERFEQHRSRAHD